MQPLDLVTYSHLLTPDPNRYPMSHGAFLAPLDQERIAVTWFAGSREWAMDVNLLCAVISPAGEQWRRIGELVSEIGFSVGNSVLARDPTGRLHLWYVRTRRYWQDGEIVHMTAETSDLAFGPKELLPLPRGWLVRGRPLFRGNLLYLPVYHEVNTVGAIWEQSLTERDGTLGETVGAPGGLIQPVVLWAGENEFRGFFRNPWPPNRMHHAYSMDRGMTWSRAHPTNLPNPNSGIDVTALAADLFVCAYNDSETARHPLSLALSRNRGITWVKMGDLEPEAAEFSYPSMALTESGLHIAYTHKRQAIKFVTLDAQQLLRFACEQC